MERRLPRTEAAKIARAYALALHDAAGEDYSFDNWDKSLKNLAAFAQNPEVDAILHNPRIDLKDLSSFIDDLMKRAQATEQERRFVDTLVNNGHFSLLPDIHDQFSTLLQQERSGPQVQVTTPAPLNETQRDNLRRLLKDRFNVSANTHIIERVDKSLIGGVVLKIDGKVIDQSVRRLADQGKNKPK